ncbi:MAG: SRPBCC family protein [Acidobacteriales bacterium]|nr:SRPBCC family protein [Terriglobales bacterium]
MAEERFNDESTGFRWNPGLIAGVIAGGALIAGYALSRKDDERTGGVGEAERLDSGEYHFIRTATIDRDADEIWQAWRDEENAPKFMKYVREVERTGGKTSHWVMQAPGGPKIEWDSEVFDERPGKAFSWRTVRGALKQEGRLLLRPAPGNRGTEVRLEMWYESPGGSVGHALATMFGRGPEQMGIDNLHRFKQWLEAGEIISVEGQPHGKRGAKGNLMQTLLREAEAEKRASSVQDWSRETWHSAVENAGDVAEKVKNFAQGPAAEKISTAAAVAADVAKTWSKKAAKSTVADSARDRWSSAASATQDVVDAAQDRWKQAAKSAKRSSMGTAWKRATKAL